MSGYTGMPLPAPGSQVRTACGGRMEFEASTPRASYGGKWLYFCLPACRQLFECSPEFSCLSEQEDSQSSK